MPGWAEGVLHAVSGPHWSMKGITGCDAIIHGVYNMETNILADKSKAFCIAGVSLQRRESKGLQRQGSTDSLLSGRGQNNPR